MLSALQNITKVTSSMSRCMSEDPRRRFVYGFTFEDMNMRLWYADRAQLIVSEPFNFILVSKTISLKGSSLMLAPPTRTTYTLYISFYLSPSPSCKNSVGTPL